MNTYYYLNARNEQQGPVRGESLLSFGVNKYTKVWTNGMTEWLPAGEVDELAPLFGTCRGSVPPPPPPRSEVPPFTPKPNTQKPDNYLVWAILSTILCCLPLGVVAIIYSNKVESLWMQGKYEEANKAANTTKICCFAALGIGILSSIISFFVFVIGLL